MAEPTQWQIGFWTFDAEGGRLIEGDNESPLEHRAARTLELLCRERGRVVPREAILAHVWEGRSVSANSVAVVIANLRRALGDDAGAPRFIATVPKRGYRLCEAAPEAVETPPPVAKRTRILRPLMIALTAMVLLGLAIVTVRDRSGADHLTIVVSRTANDTGDTQYRPLATALQALVTDRLSGMGMDVVVGQAPSAGTRREPMLWLRSRLILWNGISTLSLEAVDGVGHVAWTGMAVAPPDALASATIAQLKRFQAKIRSTGAVRRGGS
ncbi:winged helix-turn-helix domain-containing protein [Sphingomonas sp. PAMC 26605]|uniref:winged helix-turn-helix domain-containing protein n=1 Tax=Sphingomonas sp. PAMC 26605 TaxID=1112214 RepID=UPI00026CCAE4|nr:winged helix-turn-helix domain-containing protein [Sphingomonas sp. PAMC 26605]